MLRVGERFTFLATSGALNKILLYYYFFPHHVDHVNRLEVINLLLLLAVAICMYVCMYNGILEDDIW